MDCYRVLVTGRVQGVGFRYLAQQEAHRLGVQGWVRNLVDGCVETWVEGEPDAVRALISWLEHGPDHARVDSCEAQPRPAAGHTTFEITASSAGW